jgi:hypothetical protein
MSVVAWTKRPIPGLSRRPVRRECGGEQSWLAEGEVNVAAPDRTEAVDGVSAGIAAGP